jgi:signal transduction histidine kinase
MYQVVQTRREIGRDGVYEPRPPSTLEQRCAELLACVELLTEERLDEEERRLILSVAAARAAVVAEILSNASASQGAPERQLNAEPVNLMELAHRVRDLLWQKAYQAGVTLHLEGPADLPMVVGDSAWLFVALRQILENAIELGCEGGSVHVRLCVTGDLVCVRIASRGIGVTVHQLGEGLFGRPCYVDGPAPRHLSDGDMRLHVARVVAEAHGGRVWAAGGGPGESSAVVLTLPRNGRNAPRPSRERR